MKKLEDLWKVLNSLNKLGEASWPIHLKTGIVALVLAALLLSAAVLLKDLYSGMGYLLVVCIRINRT